MTIAGKGKVVFRRGFGISRIKNLELKTRSVRLKRNLFIYAKYFQWFTKCLSSLSFSRVGKQLVSTGFQPIVSRRSLPIIFFVTKKQYSFLNVLAQGVLSSIDLPCFQLKWDPLFFFSSYKRIRDRLSGFFPIFFIDADLLKFVSFKQNFVSIFIKHPIFFIWNFNSHLSMNLSFFKKMYPLYIPAGYGLYLFLFWLRFIIKLH